MVKLFLNTDLQRQPGGPNTYMFNFVPAVDFLKVSEIWYFLSCLFTVVFYLILPLAFLTTNVEIFADYDYLYYWHKDKHIRATKFTATTTRSYL